MVKNESITVPGVVIYCDVCNARGPQAAYAVYPEDVIIVAKRAGWKKCADGVDLCPNCAASPMAKFVVESGAAKQPLFDNTEKAGAMTKTNAKGTP